MKKIFISRLSALLPPVGKASSIKRNLITAVFIFGFLTAFGQELYGTLSTGGPDNLGALGHYSPATSSWITDYTFTTPFPGANPKSDLTEANGKFYGMTSAGGANSVGILFEWDPSTNQYEKKIDFSQEKGSSPWGSLTYYNGKLYGMTSGGGINNAGVIFEWDPITNNYIKKIDFNGNNGSNPKGSFTEHDDKLYAMVNHGGANGGGILIEWDPASNVIARMVSLNCDNGCYPQGSGSLTYEDGKLYGMTWYGGVNGLGAIFEWDLATNVYRKRVDLEWENGVHPTGSLTFFEGKFYGLTSVNTKAGTLFEWNPTTDVYVKKIEFGSSGDYGFNPAGSLVVKGTKLYGMTTAYGKIFEYDPSTNVFIKKIDLNLANGWIPMGSLTYSNGKFYGMTSEGGNGYGVIFEWNPDTNIYTKKIIFNSCLNGSNPLGSLTYTNGKIYGMTSGGGLNNAGVIFEFDPATKVFIKKVDLDVINGGYATSSLTYAAGKFYGLAYRGGGDGSFGTLFEWDPSTNVYSKRAGFICPTGCVPYSSLVYNGSNLYGMTEDGGNSVEGAGVIFKWNPVTNNYTVDFNFSIPQGAYSRSSLTLDGDTFYGMTTQGGANGVGVIFEWNPSTHLYTKKTDLTSAMGGNPTGWLTKRAGKFYGLANGGTNNAGVIFEWDPATNVYSKKFDFDNLNGNTPKGSLTLSGGKFYGMTSGGGTQGLGVLFEWNPVSNTYIKKVDFNAETGGSPGNVQLLEILGHDVSQTIDFSSLPIKTIGDPRFNLTATASSGLPILYTSSNAAVATISGDTVTIVGVGKTTITASQPGNENYLAAPDVTQVLTVSNPTQLMLYGLAASEGSSGAGTMFRINADGSELTTLYNFQNSTGGFPLSSLILGNDSLLYGVTKAGGSLGFGTIFKIHADGSRHTVLYNFTDNEGYPSGPLIQASDGSLFGMTNTANGGLGTVYKINRDGSGHTELYRFYNVFEGYHLPGFLMQASNGLLYGTAFSGGPYYAGMIFRMNTDGSDLMVLQNFYDHYGPIGANPCGALIEATDGFLYGVTQFGGTGGGRGTIYRINKNGGEFSVLHSFEYQGGTNPAGSLVQTPDGSLYGMTIDGLIYKINPDGSGFTLVHNFDGSDGRGPVGNLIYHDNTLFGYTTSGGSLFNDSTQMGGGVLFNYDLATSSFHKMADLNQSTGVNPMYGSLLFVNSEPVNAPTVPATNISFSNIHSTTMEVSFTPGNGTQRLVVMKAGSAPTFLPVDNTSYSGDLGNGETVVCSCANPTFNLTNLATDTEYFFTVFEFNKSITMTKYLVADAPVAHARTLMNSTIKDFSLTYFRSGEQISNFGEEVTLDLADPEIDKYTIRANVTSGEIRSVKFTLDGTTTNIDNSKPFTISHWLLPKLAAGVHTIVAQAYSKKDARGEGFESREANIHIINSAAITQFDVVDEHGTLLMTLFDGATINVGQPEYSAINIIASTNIPTVRSVKFNLNGVTARIDNRAPFGIKGKASGYEIPWQPRPGSYILTATPYMKYYAWGPPGMPLTIQFNVIDEAVSVKLATVREQEFINVYDVQTSNEFNLVAYPVPVKDKLNILINSAVASDLTLKIINVNGQVFYTKQESAELQREYAIDTNALGLAPGVYIIHLQAPDGKVLTKRFIKE